VGIWDICHNTITLNSHINSKGSNRYFFYPTNLTVNPDIIIIWHKF